MYKMFWWLLSQMLLCSGRILMCSVNSAWLTPLLIGWCLFGWRCFTPTDSSCGISRIQRCQLKISYCPSLALDWSANQVKFEKGTLSVVKMVHPQQNKSNAKKLKLKFKIPHVYVLFRSAFHGDFLVSSFTTLKIETCCWVFSMPRLPLFLCAFPLFTAKK